MKFLFVRVTILNGVTETRVKTRLHRVATGEPSNAVNIVEKCFIH